MTASAQDFKRVGDGDSGPNTGRMGAYAPLPVAGTRSRHALGFCRGDQVVVVVPRLSLRLGGDWEASVCELPPGRWTDRFTGAVFAGGEAALADLLCDFPVALLSRDS